MGKQKAREKPGETETENSEKPETDNLVGQRN